MHDFCLQCIMSEHKKCITSVAWHPLDDQLLASSSVDGQVIVWHVEEQRVLARFAVTTNSVKQDPPRSVCWVPTQMDTLSFFCGTGPLFLWRYKSDNLATVHSDSLPVATDMTYYRWHSSQEGKVALGHLDGSVSLLRGVGQKLVKRTLRACLVEGKDAENNPITALEWDPLSASYLLVASVHGGVRLLDTDNLTTIQRFELPSNAAQVQALTWVPSAPGTFLCGDATSGLLRVFSAGRSQPLETLRLKKSGFRALYLLPVTTADHTVDESCDCIHIQSKESSVYAIPGRLVCSFLDGGVGLYDLTHRRWVWLREQSHIETIFDCQFHPRHEHLLATASFDGTVKLWDVRDMSFVGGSPGNEGILYSVSWMASLSGTRHKANVLLAIGSATAGVLVYDADCGGIVHRFTDHASGSAVYGVAWSPKHAQWIASASADGFW